MTGGSPGDQCVTLKQREITMPPLPTEPDAEQTQGSRSYGVCVMGNVHSAGGQQEQVWNDLWSLVVCAPLSPQTASGR